jgi:hypothetical protein
MVVGLTPSFPPFFPFQFPWLKLISFSLYVSFRTFHWSVHQNNTEKKLELVEFSLFRFLLDLPSWF